MENEYIIPTKENPVFTCTNNYWGYTECYTWKGWRIMNEEGGSIGGDTWSVRLDLAISSLFDYIKENREDIPEESKFEIEMIDGRVDKWGDPIRTKVYSISMKQAKKFKLIK